MLFSLFLSPPDEYSNQRESNDLLFVDFVACPLFNKILFLNFLSFWKGIIQNKKQDRFSFFKWENDTKKLEKTLFNKSFLNFQNLIGLPNIDEASNKKHTHTNIERERKID